MRCRVIVLLSSLAILSSCGRGPTSKSILPEDPKGLTIGLRSPAFTEGGLIPKVPTCDGKDSSPPLAWSGVPEPARSLALICEDPDAPAGTFTHWIVFDLPADVKELGEGIPPRDRVNLGSGVGVARQVTNDFGKFGYGGPCPPSGTHRYAFRLYALDTKLDLDAGIKRDRLLRAMRGHVLAEGRLTGRYSR